MKRKGEARQKEREKGKKGRGSSRGRGAYVLDLGCLSLLPVDKMRPLQGCRWSLVTTASSMSPQHNLQIAAVIHTRIHSLMHIGTPIMRDSMKIAPREIRRNICQRVGGRTVVCHRKETWRTEYGNNWEMLSLVKYSASHQTGLWCH